MSQPEIAQSVAVPAPPRSAWRILKKGLLACGLALFAAVVFCIALIVTLPASAVREFVTLPPQITAIYGTLWHGRANLQGGYTLEWDVVPEALIRATIQFELTLEGADTLMTGIAGASPWAITASEVTGRVGQGLLQLVPDIPVQFCRSRAVVDIGALRLTRQSATADGRVRIDEGVCTDVFDRDLTVPSMDLDLLTQGADAIALLRDRDGQLAQFTLAGDRRFIVRIEPEGATLVPGLPTSGPIILEYPF